MKKLLLLAPCIGTGGIETVLATTTAALRQSYDITVVYFYHTDFEHDLGVQKICLDVPFAKNAIGQILVTLKRAIKLLQIKKAHGFDVTYALGEVCSVTNALTKTRAERCVISVHGMDSVPKSAVKAFIYRLILKRADASVFVSKALKELFLQRVNIDNTRAHTVYNPFDTDRIDALKLEDFSAIKKDKNGLTLLSLGRLDADKNIELAIKTTAHLQIEHGGAHLYIAGDGPNKQSLQALVTQLNAQKCVTFLGSCANPYSVLKNADILLFTSLHEGFGNVLVEALACGCGVISADCKAGPREILAPETPFSAIANCVEEAEYGLLLPPQTPQDSAETTRKHIENIANGVNIMLKNDGEVLQKYKAKGALRAKDFSIKNYTDSLIKVLEGK